MPDFLDKLFCFVLNFSKIIIIIIITPTMQYSISDYGRVNEQRDCSNPSICMCVSFIQMGLVFHENCLENCFFILKQMFMELSSQSNNSYLLFYYTQTHIHTYTLMTNNTTGSEEMMILALMVMVCKILVTC